MAAGDIYQVVLNSVLAQQQVKNVFHYLCVDPEASEVATIAALADGFEEKWFPTAGQGLLNSAMAASLDYVGITVTNLFNETVFQDVTFTTPYEPATGTVDAPLMLAYGFFSDRVRGDVRRGQKRFAGVIESAVNIVNIEAAAQTTLQSTIGTLLGQDVTSSTFVNASFSPVVVGRIEYTTTGGKQAYRLPKLPSEARYFVARNWTLRDQVTTQNSRKVGRGA